MRISTTIRYGVRALYELACQENNSPMQIRDIALSQDLTPRYLEQIFHKLRKSGLIRSQRGRKGGYYLSKGPENITIGEIIRSLEGPIELVHCSDLGSSEKKCPREKNCPTKILWKESSEIISTYFDSVTLRDVCNKSQCKENNSKGFLANFFSCFIKNKL
jgi:Rrf2 family protein